MKPRMLVLQETPSREYIAGAAKGSPTAAAPLTKVFAAKALAAVCK